MLPPLLASHMGGGGMVDRYMGWYGGYGMAYMRVLRCCIMWCVRQSHCRGSTVRLIVFALGLVHPKPQNACRGICRADSTIASLHSPHEILRCRIIQRFHLRVC